MSEYLISEQRIKYEKLCAHLAVQKASEHEAVAAISQLCDDNERLALLCVKRAAELTRLRAMLTPPDDVPCYTVDALKYNDAIDLPGDMPMVPADLVNRLRARCDAADKLAEAVRYFIGANEGVNIEAYQKAYNALAAALSAYEEAAMTVEIVPPQWVFTCDCCKAKETGSSAIRPSKWIEISISQCAVDWGGNPCADTSVNLLVCRDCGIKATSAMNATFAAIQSAATEAEGRGDE